MEAPPAAGLLISRSDDVLPVISREARWQSGHAAACKAVYAGSIPTLAFGALFSRVLPSTYRGSRRPGTARRLAGANDRFLATERP